MFDLDNRCDLCGKALLVSTEPRTRCDQCVRYGAPQDVTPPIRVIGAQTADTAAVPCNCCGRDKCIDGATTLPLVEGYCLSCRMDGAHQAG